MDVGREPYDESYGSKILARSFRPSLANYFRTATPHHLVYQGSWLWTGFADGEGNRYACMREWKTEYSLNVLISKLDPDPRAVAARLYKNLNMGIIRFEQDPEGKLIRIEPAFGGSAFQIGLQPQNFRWKDADGELDIEFAALGPALQYLCPGEREDSLYLSELCGVTGSLQGRPVRGFGGIDCAFGTAGIGWLQSKVYRLLEKYWIVWANRFEDQSLEYGICFDGEADFELGFIVRDGEARISGCSVRMDHSGDGFPREAEIRMGEDLYRFRTTARVAKIKGIMQWANGEMRRMGDGRKIVEAFGWMEFFR